MTVRSESRQEERKDGGQISGVRSKCRVRPLLDQEELAHFLKCKIEEVVQLYFGVLAIEVLDTGSWSVKTLCNKNAEIAI